MQPNHKFMLVNCSSIKIGFFPSYSGHDRANVERGNMERGILDKAEIRSALQCWQQRAAQPSWNSRGSGDGKPAALNSCSTYTSSKGKPIHLW